MSVAGLPAPGSADPPSRAPWSPLASTVGSGVWIRFGTRYGGASAAVFHRTSLFSPGNPDVFEASKSRGDTIDIITIPSVMAASTRNRDEKNRERRRAHEMLALAACAMLAVGPMMGQGSRRQKPAENTPVLTRDAATMRDWTVRVEIGLSGLTAHRTDARQTRPATSAMVLNRAQILYPLLPDTSTSISQEHRLEAFARVEGKVLDDTPRIERGYQGLSSIAILDIPDIDSTRLNIQFEISMTAFETKIDEARAREHPWPAADWSPELLLCMEPQLFVECQDEAVLALVKKWTRGNPRGVGPYTLAKMLAAEAIDHINFTEPNLESGAGALVDRIGTTRVVAYTSGYRVFGAAWAAREGVGSKHDLPCLYAAVLRAAGLPARLVIGYDIDESEKNRQSKPVLRSWVEFFLPRLPAQGPITPNDGEWIPVDISRQKDFSSRAPSLSQPWVYFGNNNELDRVCPLAFHWLPPTVCTNAGPAAIWGWVPDPANPGVTQELKFWARPTPVRGDDPPPRR